MGKNIYIKRDLCYNPNLSVQLTLTDLDIFAHTMGDFNSHIWKVTTVNK